MFSRFQKSCFSAGNILAGKMDGKISLVTGASMEIGYASAKGYYYINFPTTFELFIIQTTQLYIRKDQLLCVEILLKTRKSRN